MTASFHSNERENYVPPTACRDSLQGGLTTESPAGKPASSIFASSSRLKTSFQLLHESKKPCCFATGLSVVARGTL
jgi:hypothetical protein